MGGRTVQVWSSCTKTSFGWGRCGFPDGKYPVFCKKSGAKRWDVGKSGPEIPAESRTKRMVVIVSATFMRKRLFFAVCLWKSAGKPGNVPLSGRTDFCGNNAAFHKVSTAFSTARAKGGGGGIGPGEKMNKTAFPKPSETAGFPTFFPNRLSGGEIRFFSENPEFFRFFALAFLCRKAHGYAKMWKRKKIVGLHRTRKRKRNGLPTCFFGRPFLADYFFSFFFIYRR